MHWEEKEAKKVVPCASLQEVCALTTNKHKASVFAFLEKSEGKERAFPTEYRSLYCTLFSQKSVYMAKEETPKGALLWVSKHAFLVFFFSLETGQSALSPLFSAVLDFKPKRMEQSLGEVSAL
jgi:hypothetical protein